MPAIFTEENDTPVVHSDEVQDIITKVPSWLLRWGITLFFGILLLIVLLSALISYPDVVTAALKIKSVSPPKPVIAGVSGKLDKFLVTPHQIVKAGQPIAYIYPVEKAGGKGIITAPQSGIVSFSGMISEGMAVDANQVLFYIIQPNEQFFGEMTIPQSSMGKVKEGQEVLVKLKSYPFEEYGMIRGRIKYIAEVPYKDSVFISKVDFKTANFSDMKRPVHLKQGMTADAEIITQNATLIQRLSRSIFKVIGNK